MASRAMSWGRWPRFEPSRVLSLGDRFSLAAPLAQSPSLPYGNGRSYGDVCLNEAGTLIRARTLDRFIEFDPTLGTLDCEAGVLLKEIIDLVLPSGWFPPVTPGTALVTVGGAIANDVHGKNHHRAASFSSHVIEFELCRSDGTRMICSPDENPAWFAATIGGLGLTGLITRARLKLRRVPGPWFRGDSRRFTRLRDFFELSRQSDADYEYTVAWIDCTASGAALGRGIFMRANHAAAGGVEPGPGTLAMPFTPPISMMNRISLPLLSELYYRRPGAVRDDALWHYRPFLYPLDGIMNWNRLYGPRGFFQYQCVLPPHNAEASLQEILARISASGAGSFLSVLKNFGNLAPLGLLSFPRPGTTLALDFPNHGEITLKLLDSLDEVTRSAGGAVYPAKDARMSPAAFRDYFPAWREFSSFVDPKFSSSFWRRVQGVAA